MSSVAKNDPWLEIEPYKVSVDEYRTFRRDGYLIVRGLVQADHVKALLEHTEDLMHDRITVPGADPLPVGATLKEIETRLLGALPSVPARARRRSGSNGARCFGDADDDVHKGSGRLWPGFSSGHLLHTDISRYFDRCLDCT